MRTRLLWLIKNISSDIKKVRKYIIQILISLEIKIEIKKKYNNFLKYLKLISYEFAETSFKNLL